MRLVLAVLAGIVTGSLVNMGLILAGSAIVPPPPGVDTSDTESIAQSIELFEVRHFVFPFLAHALGTLAGAVVAGLLARQRRNVALWGVAIFFFAGGVATSFMIPAPVTYIAIDLVFAYFPMAVLAGKVQAYLQDEN